MDHPRLSKIALPALPRGKDVIPDIRYRTSIFPSRTFFTPPITSTFSSHPHQPMNTIRGRKLP
ncbi:MAG: hypothetical protein OEW33_16380, partial [Nitrospirota bacterium]|nr:hypothetical protein [Nitrospirota bacterium]